MEQEGDAESAFTVVVLDRVTSALVPEARVKLLGDGKPFTAGVTDAVGEAMFEDFGSRVREAFRDRRPEIRIEVQRQGQPVKVVHRPFRWQMFDATGGTLRFLFSAAAPRSGEQEDTTSFTVHGQVALNNGEPAADVTVRVCDRDMRSETLLGQATVGEDGHYEIQYDPTAAEGGEYGGADLRFRAFTRTGRELSVSIEGRKTASIGGDEILFNVRPEEEVDLQIGSKDARPSRYEELVDIITPLLEGVEMPSLSSDDVYFLHHETDAPLHEVNLVAEDARLSQQTGMPQGVYFGLGIFDIGMLDPGQQEDGVENPALPRLDILTVLDEPVGSLIDAVHSAIEQRLIPAKLGDDLETIRAPLEALM